MSSFLSYLDIPAIRILFTNWSKCQLFFFLWETSSMVTVLQERGSVSLVFFSLLTIYPMRLEHNVVASSLSRFYSQA